MSITINSLAFAVLVSGAEEDYDKKYFIPYKELICSICFYTTMGNHDYYTDKGSPYLSIFVLPENNPAGSEKYYSFDYGNAHVVCIDSNGYTTLTMLPGLLL